MRIALLLAVLALAFPATANARPNHLHAHHHRAYVGGNDVYYIAASGHRVHRPERSSSRPAGATARCRDSSWSFSENHRGTCSHHGGVASWL